jgi:3-hydroxyacyl-CoA dehydrogenase
MAKPVKLEIKRAAVIGSGVMGSGIAAHFANAGIPVVLLDIVPEGAEDRSKLAKGAIERLLKADPAPFMHKSCAKLVTAGNLEDDLGLLADVDWIVEAIIENPKHKRALYEKLEGVRKAGSVVSSNTSTIPLKLLTEGLPERFRQDFLITHFFNPPRYMRLLELVTGPETRSGLADAIADFCDRTLGKGVVPCNDTPGFIANRIGTFWLQAAVNAAFDLEVPVEEADAVMSRPVGIPKTGVFGLIDLVGIDLMPLLADSLLKTLPEGDAYRAIYRDFPEIRKMIEEGYTGRKGKGGFYALDKGAGGKRVKLARDLKTGEYRPAQKADPDAARAGKAGLAAVINSPDRAGKYARTVLLQTLAYSASLIPEIAGDVTAIDRAMELGYNWKSGPFRLIDQIGVDAFAEALAKDGIAVPELVKKAAGRSFYKLEESGQETYLAVDGSYKPVVRPEGVLLLSDIKRTSKPLKKNGSAALWDIGDGVVCLEFTSKMNALDDKIMEMIGTAVTMIAMSDDLKALVIHNEGTNFSVGANLGLALFAANIGLFPQIGELVEGGQRAYLALKYAPFPVVSAPSGMALGGGCEILLHSAHVQAHAETYAGLVEVGVGLIPGWGGCKEMLARGYADPKRTGGRGPMPAIRKAFEQIGTAQVAKSALEARDMFILRDNDGVTMNRDRVLADAKAKALELAADYTPPEPPVFRLPGPAGRAALEMAVADLAKSGKATPHDVTVTKELAFILSGGDTEYVDEIGEDDIMKLEREAFMRLVSSEPTLARMEHMLTTGKPLRN